MNYIYIYISFHAILLKQDVNVVTSISAWSERKTSWNGGKVRELGSEWDWVVEFPLTVTGTEEGLEADGYKIVGGLGLYIPLIHRSLSLRAGLAGGATTAQLISCPAQNRNAGRDYNLY